MTGEIFPCVYPRCAQRFEHPNEDYCEAIDGRCAHLVAAGWRAAWVRVFLDQSHHAGELDGRMVSSFGAWLCPEHAK